MIITRGFGTPDYPAESDVRDDVIYGLNSEYTGTLTFLGTDLSLSVEEDCVIDVSVEVV